MSGGLTPKTSEFFRIPSSSSSSSSSSMLHFLPNTVLFQTRNINGRDHSTTTTTTTHLLCFLLRLQKNRNPSLIRIKSISSYSSSSISISSSTNHTCSSPSSFVVSYLINSCGLSEDKAISVSKELQLESLSGPDSVLTLLENNGFTKPYISKLITKHPSVLLADAHKTLKPKLEFFNSVGLSGLDLAKLLSKDPNILQRSLENQIIPSFAFLKSIVHTDKNVIKSLKRSTWLLLEDPGKRLVPNIGVLRDQGVPEFNISMLLITQPASLLINVDRFQEIVEEINGMGIDPLKLSFVSAIHVLTSMTQSTWEAKLNVFTRWGWSEEEILTAFKIQPRFMTVSEKKITAIMDFLVNQMGYKPSFIAKRRGVLLYSLEKRIVPRCMVIRVLVSKGLVKKHPSITTTLTIGKKSFLEKYVIKYDQELSEVLLKAYQGQLDCLELHQLVLKELMR